MKTKYVEIDEDGMPGRNRKGDAPLIVDLRPLGGLQSVVRPPSSRASMHFEQGSTLASRLALSKSTPDRRLAGCVVDERVDLVDDRRGRPVGRRTLRTWRDKRSMRVVATQYDGHPILFVEDEVVETPLHEVDWGLWRRRSAGVTR
jgi:hypothetical protein